MQRREFLKTSAVVAAGSAVSSSGLIDALSVTERQETSGSRVHAMRDPVSFVKPMIGTAWRGHMFPGAAAPFGLVQLSPDTSGPPEPKWNSRGDYYQWEHCSGYHYPDNVIVGFTHTHLQGTGGIDLGDILIMPVVEGRNWSWEPGIPDPQAEMQSLALGTNSGWVFADVDSGYRSFFSHDQELAKAGYYSAYLQTPDVRAELTATTHCAMHRYRYPELPPPARHGIVLDLVHGLGSKVSEAELNVESDGRITGKRRTHGWARDRYIYFVIEVSRPIASAEVNVNGKISSAEIGTNYADEQVKARFTFSQGPEPLVLRVGISPISIEGARRNLAAQIQHWNFDAVASETEQTWSKAVGIVGASFSDHALGEAFYTSAYHGLVAPSEFNDVDGTYRGQDSQIHPNPGFTKYTTLSIWDIYRGDFPFIMLMQPHRTNDIINTLVADYRELNQHALPMWPLWGNETWSMTGFHAAGMILGAYARGFRNFDVEAAYAAIRDTALTGAEAKGNRELQQHFRQFGYVPVDLHGGSVSCTLDISYDYWCAGAMAELLGKHDDAASFYKLGQNYKNLFDPTTGFMRGKTQSGKWREPFRPDEEYDDYVETDAWQASFSVPHDVQGLIDLHGGDEAFIRRLDALFRAPSDVVNGRPDITGMVGQDAQGNEPSNHHPYLYPFAGAPWKTQYWVRKVAALYNNTPKGIPGNDDCGQLSSWFAFAALGFYPVNAATGVYVIGSPLTDHAVFHNSLTGARFAIIAENNSADNIFIQSAELNGKELTRSWLTHAEIVDNGELRFRMGGKPNKEWASKPSDRPPSGLLNKTTPH